VLWYKIAGAAESKDVTLNWTDCFDSVLFIEEWQGLSTPTLDKVAHTDDDQGLEPLVNKTSRSSGTTDTTTADDELCVAGFMFCTGCANPAWSNSFIESNNYSGLTLIGYRIVTTTGAYETTLTFTEQKAQVGGLIATFKAGGAAQPSGSAAITGNGAIASTGTKDANGLSVISAGGAQISVGTKQAFSDSTISGAGAITATGEVGVEEHSGPAIISGSGGVLSDGAKGALLAAAFSAIGDISSEGTKSASSDAVISSNAGIRARWPQALYPLAVLYRPQALRLNSMPGLPPYRPTARFWPEG
jgi:hypothetical protein